ncbi:hypothetical protein OG426_50540 [Streptomyces canus]|uniref:hypothetical protein n=1 Tax=Streptomyces canus TaxID=58343 RepID=UPI0022519496|nr:hypothetical protein [Streptomyces canus]MCX4854484.1 hypothetical protein [Streptomyces canus]WSW40080.1 hypothetical protein OG426_50540 [Streptomyces canus]
MRLTREENNAFWQWAVVETMSARLDELETDLLPRRQRAIDEGLRGESNDSTPP